jgi:hypothetical protein
VLEKALVCTYDTKSREATINLKFSKEKRTGRMLRNLYPFQSINIAISEIKNASTTRPTGTFHIKQTTASDGQILATVEGVTISNKEPS